MPDRRVDVGHNIHAARRRKGLGLEVLAQKVGVSKGQISDWERGRNEPRLDALVAIAKALEISVDRLVFGDEVFYRQAVAEAKAELEGEIAELRRQLVELSGGRRPL